MKRSIVLITGAAGALGRTVAEAFAADDVHLVLVDVDAKALQHVFGASSADRTIVAADLTDPARTLESLAPILEQQGPVQVLCNIAGGFSMGLAVHETPDEAWRHLIDLNVATLINACRAVVPGMLRAQSGKIINVAAAGAVKGAAGMGSYCVSKSAVARLTETMALELRESGINVNAVAPSIIDSASNRAAMPAADPEHWVAPADLANVIRFLASENARAIHGAVIPVVGLS